MPFDASGQRMLSDGRTIRPVTAVGRGQVVRYDYFFACSKYFKSGGRWPFFIGMMVPSPLRK